MILILIPLIIDLSNSLFIPELLSGKGTPFCPRGLRAHGWLLMNYYEGLTIEPENGPIRIVLSQTSTRIVFKFCESKSITSLPQGDYCVIKGRSDCPLHFNATSLTPYEPDQVQKSLNFGDLELCCSSFISDPIPFPVLPPFAVVKKSQKCERFVNTTVSEVLIRPKYKEDIVVAFCYYDVSPCSVNNGGCQQVCYHDQSVTTCSCYQGYSLINSTVCRRDIVYYGVDAETSNLITNSSSSSPILFTTIRDHIVMMITVAAVLMLVFLVLLLLIRFHHIVCLISCFKKTGSATISGSIHRSFRGSNKSSESERPVGRTRRLNSTANFSRDSISAPQVANVAVDLLNRPKRITSLVNVNMHDLTSSNRGSYYENHEQNDSLHESIYDSLDRRGNHRVELQKQQSVKYDEPDKEQVVQPLGLGDDQYYLEPDVDAEPETPLPIYSPGADQPPPVYTFANEHHPHSYASSSVHQEPHYYAPSPGHSSHDLQPSIPYQDPSSQFSHGTLGRSINRVRSPSYVDPGCVVRAASVARITPTPRVIMPWEQTQLLKPSSLRQF